MLDTPVAVAGPGPVAGAGPAAGGVDPAAALDAADAKTRGAVVSTIGAQAPDATLPPVAVDVIGASLAESIGALTDGQVKIPIVRSAEPGKLPAETYTALVGYQGMIDGLLKAGVTEAKPYQVDAKAAAANGDALVEAANTIREAGRDKALKAAVLRAAGNAEKKPAEKPAKPEAPPAKPPSQVDELVGAMLDRRKK